MPRGSIVLVVLGMLLVWFARSPGALGYLGLRWAVISLGVVGTTLMWLYLLQRPAAGARGPGWLALAALSLWTGIQLLGYNCAVLLYVSLRSCLPGEVPPESHHFEGPCGLSAMGLVLAEVLVWSGTGVGVLLGSIALVRSGPAWARRGRQGTPAVRRDV